MYNTTTMCVWMHVRVLKGWRSDVWAVYLGGGGGGCWGRSWRDFAQKRTFFTFRQRAVSLRSPLHRFNVSLLPSNDGAADGIHERRSNVADAPQCSVLLNLLEEPLLFFHALCCFSHGVFSHESRNPVCLCTKIILHWDMDVIEVFPHQTYGK